MHSYRFTREGVENPLRNGNALERTLKIARRSWSRFGDMRLFRLAWGAVTPATVVLIL